MSRCSTAETARNAPFLVPLTVSSVALFFANYGDRIILQSGLGFEALGVYGIGAQTGCGSRHPRDQRISARGGAADLPAYAEPGTPASLAQLLRLYLCAGLLAVIALRVRGHPGADIHESALRAASHLVPVLAFADRHGKSVIFVPGLTRAQHDCAVCRHHHRECRNRARTDRSVRPCRRETGAAFAVLASATIGFALHATFSQRVYPIPIQWPRMIGGYIDHRCRD